MMFTTTYTVTKTFKLANPYKALSIVARLDPSLTHTIFLPEFIFAWQHNEADSPLSKRIRAQIYVHRLGNLTDTQC